MLEALVSSRIRRALLEHILSRPTDRFYLRGLAKDLHLSVSPLRRELKRLEQAGVLQAAQEGNILFYTVNTQSPMFLQLQRVSHDRQPAPAQPVPQVSAEPSPVVVAAAPMASTTSLPRWRAPLSEVVMIGTVGIGMVLIAVAGVSYLRLAKERAASGGQIHGAQAQMAPAAKGASAGGVIKSSRWQIQTGGVGGGFSSVGGGE